MDLLLPRKKRGGASNTGPLDGYMSPNGSSGAEQASPVRKKTNLTPDKKKRKNSPKGKVRICSMQVRGHADSVPPICAKMREMGYVCTQFDFYFCV